MRCSGRYGSSSPTIKARQAGECCSESPERPCYSPRAGTATTKLDHVSGKFSNLYTDLESEKQARRLTEQEQQQQLRERLEAVEATLQSEIVRRQESERALHVHVETELARLAERVSGQLKEAQRSIRAGLDHVHRSVREVNSVLSEEREQRKVDVDHVGTQLCLRLDEVVGALDDERFQRLEQERQTLKRVGEDLLKLSERIDGEQKCREQAVNDVVSDLHGFVQGNQGREDAFSSRVMDELGALRTKLSMEVSDRMHEDEAIVHAINEYTRALQEGLRIVGTQ